MSGGGGYKTMNIHLHGTCFNIINISRRQKVATSKERAHDMEWLEP